MTTTTNGKRSPLTVHTAEVRTTAVEIKTMTVTGRQVTLAVFRQLIEEPLVDLRNGALAGVPWGKVNYHPDKCKGPEAMLTRFFQLINTEGPNDE